MPYDATAGILASHSVSYAMCHGTDQRLINQVGHTPAPLTHSLALEPLTYLLHSIDKTSQYFTDLYDRCDKRFTQLPCLGKSTMYKPHQDLSIIHWGKRDTGHLHGMPT